MNFSVGSFHLKSSSGPFWEVNVTYKLEAEFADCRQVFSDTKVKLYILRIKTVTARSTIHRMTIVIVFCRSIQKFWCMTKAQQLIMTLVWSESTLVYHVYLAES